MEWHGWRGEEMFLFTPNLFISLSFSLGTGYQQKEAASLMQWCGFKAA